MISHYQATRDPAYAARIYETLKEMATFWQDYPRVTVPGTSSTAILNIKAC